MVSGSLVEMLRAAYMPLQVGVDPSETEMYRNAAVEFLRGEDLVVRVRSDMMSFGNRVRKYQDNIRAMGSIHPLPLLGIDEEYDHEICDFVRVLNNIGVGYPLDGREYTTSFQRDLQIKALKLGTFGLLCAGGSLALSPSMLIPVFGLGGFMFGKAGMFSLDNRDRLRTLYQELEMTADYADRYIRKVSRDLGV